MHASEDLWRDREAFLLGSQVRLFVELLLGINVKISLKEPNELHGKIGGCERCRGCEGNTSSRHEHAVEFFQRLRGVEEMFKCLRTRENIKPSVWKWERVGIGNEKPAVEDAKLPVELTSKLHRRFRDVNADKLLAGWSEKGGNDPCRAPNLENTLSTEIGKYFLKNLESARVNISSAGVLIEEPQETGFHCPVQELGAKFIQAIHLLLVERGCGEFNGRDGTPFFS
ncbi:MAG: hypothetical protein G01um101438_538 [Parcubacteria group bacterium Gr01-1014_38]|nr:MAG: hypothetical protein G01um101438_538 [Parcubacteria group bacterium Gr01-1014_38]